MIGASVGIATSNANQILLPKERKSQSNQHRRRRRRRRSVVDSSEQQTSQPLDDDISDDKVRHNVAVINNDSSEQKLRSIDSGIEQVRQRRGNELERTLVSNQTKSNHSRHLDDKLNGIKERTHNNERRQYHHEQLEHHQSHQHLEAAARLASATNQLRQSTDVSTTTDPSNNAKEPLPGNREAHIKPLLVSLCLPIASCFMLALLFWYVWGYCKRLARFKHGQKQESKVAKLKKQATNGLKEIRILGCERQDDKLFERQLTINMETDELSSDDRSTSGGSMASQGNNNFKKNPLNIFKVPKSRADTKNKSTKSPGFLKYSLSYDFERSLLLVSILEARDLPSMDLCGTSDPYVKLYLTSPNLSDNNKQQISSACFKTKTHKRSLNPTFNETFQFEIVYSELVKHTLHLAVYDYDRLSKHDEIGQVSIRLSSLDLSQLHDNQWCELERTTQSLQNGQLGDICLSLRYVPTAGKLTVVILEARKLKRMDLAGLSDPYVKLALFNEQGERMKKKKTSIKKCTLNPHYNESFSFEIPFEQVQRVQLHVTVIDYDRIGTSEPIGRIILGCETTTGATELRHWMDMLASPRRPIAQWHSLKQLTGGTEQFNGNNAALAFTRDDNITS